MTIEIDFLYHFIICILALATENKKNKYLDPYIVSNYSEERFKSGAIFLTGFCLIAFCLLIPLIAVQLVNVITNTTTHDRFAFKFGGRSMTNSKHEGSSNLINDEDQIYSVISGLSAPTTLIQETTTKYCCFKTRTPSMFDSRCEEMRRSTLREIN